MTAGGGDKLVVPQVTQLCRCRAAADLLEPFLACGHVPLGFAQLA